jgi:hypothetical protein
VILLVVSVHLLNLLLVVILESGCFLFLSHYLSTENSGLCLKVDSSLNVFGIFFLSKTCKFFSNITLDMHIKD